VLVTVLLPVAATGVAAFSMRRMLRAG
jgi:hypothetical protein